MMRGPRFCCVAVPTPSRARAGFLFDIASCWGKTEKKQKWDAMSHFLATP